MMDKSNDTPQSIINMTEFRAEIGYTALSQVEAYWEGLRGTRLMPKRSEIDPRGIETALEYTFVLERIAPGMARIRIAGTHLSDLMGMEVRGMPLTSLITPPCRRQINDLLEDVCQRPTVCEVRLNAETSITKPHMDARLLLLPLKSDLGDVSRILGCLVAQGELGHAPRRFDVVGAKIRSISAPSTAPTDPKHASMIPDASKPTHADGFSEPARSFETRTPRADVPYLRVVKSDD